MIALLQRVSRASVRVAGEEVARIGAGLLILLGVERGDAVPQAERLVERVLGYRVFPDASGRMNLNLAAAGGDLLVVPQFTLAANTRKGMRASFTSAAEPERGKALYDYFLKTATRLHPATVGGRFGADMQVELINDGPVTFWLQTRPEPDRRV